MNAPLFSRASVRGKRRLMVCRSAELADRQHRVVPVLFKGRPHTAIVLRHRGRIYAYLNQCVHMVRRLDCMEDEIFDSRNEHLRCSMHGIAYHPATGESLSVLCSGERLEALRSAEIDQRVYLADKRIEEPC
jgi:nitrite reductase/ring-hydroxylating ferredoxin subunit